MKLHELNRGDLFKILPGQISLLPVQMAELSSSGLNELATNTEIVYQFIKPDGMYGQVVCADPQLHKKMCEAYDTGSPFFVLGLLIEVEKIEN